MPPSRRATPAAKRTAASKTKRRPKRKRIRFRSPVKVVLFECKRCKLKTNNPIKKLFHTCLMGFSPSQKNALRQRTAAQDAAARRNLQAARQARSK